MKLGGSEAEPKADCRIQRGRGEAKGYSPNAYEVDVDVN